MKNKDDVTGRSTVLDDPKTFLGAALALGTDGAIRMQEKMGQTDVVFSDNIPVDRHGIADDRLLALGFVLGPRAVDREIFQSATLPPGWKKKASDHDMWSYIIDERGRTRFSIFYKAAFYDRSAHMHATCRFAVDTDYAKSEKTTKHHVTVTDGGKVIKRFNGTLTRPPADDPRTPGYDAAVRAYYDELDALRAQARAWLLKERPEYKDFTAYWNET